MMRTAASFLFFAMLLVAGCSGGTGGDQTRTVSGEGPFEYVQGKHRMEQGNVFGASFLFEKAVAKYPGFLEARLKLIEAYLALAGEDDEYFEKAYDALDELESIVGDQDLDLRKARAQAYVAQGRADDAIAVYEEILVERQDECEYWILLGRAEIQKAITLRGEEGLEAQMDQLAVAEKTFSEALKLCPDNYDAYYGRSVWLEQNKEYDKLVELYRDLMERFPDSPEPLRSYANAHFMKRDWEEASTAFKDLLERDLREEERLKYIVTLNKLGLTEEEERQSQIYLDNLPRFVGPVHRTKLDILKERLNIQSRTDQAGVWFEEGSFQEALDLWQEVRADVAPFMDDPEFGDAAKEKIVWLDRRIRLARAKLRGES